MRYIKLGNTGLDILPVVLGCMTYGEPDRGHPVWSLSEEESRPLIKRALEAGINFFDTANMYSQGSSEEIVGRALRDLADRDEVVVATKVRHPMRPGPNGSDCRARRSWPRSTTACAGSAPTTSICTRSTAWTRRLRSRRRWRPCTQRGRDNRAVDKRPLCRHALHPGVD